MQSIHLLIRLLALLFILNPLSTFSQENPKPPKCNLKKEVDKKNGVKILRTNSFIWLKFEKTMRTTDTTYEFCLLLVENEGEFIDLTINFTDGTKLLRPGSPVYHYVAGGVVYFYTYLIMDPELISALRTKTLASCTAGKNTNRGISENKALKQKSDLECLLLSY